MIYNKSRITNKQNDGQVHGIKSNYLVTNITAFFASKVVQKNLGDHLAQITTFKFKSKSQSVAKTISFI